MNQSERIAIFVQEIWQWYERHKRTLPWRDLQIEDDAQRAYQIMVSEIMLQQTQVPRVISKYKEFLEIFPTLADLAKANNKEVIMAWRGMGYNSRALRLRDAAAQIQTSDFGLRSSVAQKGNSPNLESRIPQKYVQVQFPITMEDLLSIKGIGNYTAAAIRNFAFNIPTPCIDTNIRRILHRVFYGPENKHGEWQKSDKELLVLADKVLDAAIESPIIHNSKFIIQNSAAASWHGALMDFGSMVCTKTSPKWDICPLTKQGICKASYKVPKLVSKPKKEPGRLVGSVCIPNRIFRGRVIEALRDNAQGLELLDIGNSICIDWNESEHKKWLEGIIKKLMKDKLVEKKGANFLLQE